MIYNIKKISNAWLGNDNMGRYVGYPTFEKALIKLVNTCIDGNNVVVMTTLADLFDGKDKIERVDVVGIKVEEIYNGFLIHIKEHRQESGYQLFSTVNDFPDVLSEHLGADIIIESI